MKTALFNRINFTAAFVAFTLFMGGCKDSTLEEAEELSAISVQEASASQTAQSIMVDINVNTPVIEGEEVWTFDQKAAGLAYFTGGDPNNLSKAAHDQRCTFFNGGTLINHPVGRNIIITPIAANNPVAPRTGWTLVANSAASSVPVTVDIKIAGQSVVVNKGRSKYSFSLANTDGSRVTINKVEVSGQADQFPGHTILTNDESNTCLAGILYVGNGGTFGNVSYLKTNLTMGEIIASNQYGSTAVCGNAAIAKVDQLVYQMGEGTFSIKVSGTIKGNGTEFTSPQSFSVTKNITIDANGCKVTPAQ